MCCKNATSDHFLIFWMKKCSRIFNELKMDKLAFLNFKKMNHISSINFRVNLKKYIFCFRESGSHRLVRVKLNYFFRLREHSNTNS